MSGCSGSQDCPRCSGKDSLMTYSDWKRFEGVSGECINCGFAYYTKAYQMELSEVNEMRTDRELKPLKEIPKKFEEFDEIYINGDD